MKRKPLVTWFPFRFALLIAPLIAAWPQRAHATPYYWDVNGTTAGFSTVVGAWNTGAFWGPNATGTGGTYIVNPLATDDLNIVTSTTNTGTITVTGAKTAGSLTFASGVGAVTITGGTSITIGGGASSGIFNASASAQVISTPLILAAASPALNFTNSAAGLLTIGAVTGSAASGTQTLNVNATAAGGITLNGVIGNGAAGGNVALTITGTGAGVKILSAANTYSGGTTISNGSLQLNNNTAAGTGAINLVSGGATVATRLLVNGGVTIGNTINLGTVFGIAGQGSLQQTGTGQGRINGPINITGSPSAGGHFVGGNAVGNELVLGGAINSTVASLNQRDGRVVYAGGGSGGSWNALTVTNTALVGATNGIPTAVAITLGGSGSATLNLNGFNQTLASATLGNAGANSAFTGTIVLGANTLGLTGDITTLNTGTGNATHAITATAGGTIDFGATPRNISVADSSALDDLVITGATITGNGVTKTGAGTLALRDAVFSTPLTVSAGELATGTTTATGSATLNGLAFTGTNALRMKVGPGGDLITVTTPGGLTTGGAGATAVSLSQFGGALANGIYNLIGYSGASPGTSGFTLGPVGHTTSSLVDTGSAIALQVTGNDKVIWDGTTSSAWTTAATGNWKLATPMTATDYIESDDVVFNDAPTSAAVVIGTNVAPSNVTFNNTTATAYSLTGAGGITGATGLTKNGNGTLTIGTPNTYGGATTINGGTLTASYTTANPLPVASAVNIAGGATLRIQHDGGTFGLVNTLSGTGTVVVDPSAITTGNRDISNVTWNASAFTGTLRLAPTLGTMRIAVDNPLDLGGAVVDVKSGGQIFFNTANIVIPNNITVAGSGYSEAAGFLGAIRASNPTTFNGIITVDGTAKLGALGGNMIVSNTLTGGTLTFGGSNNASSETLTLTGNAGGLTGLVINDGVATGNAASITVNVGNNTASGTLGAVPVSLLADGFKNSVLRFDRTDGYTLGAAVTSTSAAANHVRTFVDSDTLGAGFSDGGFAINLGGSLATTGGSFRVGQNRAGAIANLSGTLTAGTVLVGSAQGTATLNLDSGALVNAGAVRVATAGANTTSTLNIKSGSTLNAFNLQLGDFAGAGGVANQAAGSAVNVNSQLRVGHFGTNTSIYNMNGGTLTLTGASSDLTPSTVGAGGVSATGDNNINALAVAALVGGGIYLGVDGTGILNHNAGTVTTNWIVLDNRGATGAGANMPDGIDRYNLSGAGSVLNLRSTWGLIGRAEGSYAVSLGGGTVRVDNTGTSGAVTTTGANITVPLDATIDTVAGTTTNLDTNGAGNGFTLTKDVRGTGTLNLTGAGAINLTTGGVQGISPALTGTNPITKLGTGTTTLSGTASGYTGNITVSAGRLNLPASLGAGNVTVADGAAIGGEPVLVNTLTLGSTTGSTIFFDPNTPGALSTTNLVVNGTNNIDVTAAPTGAGPYTVINTANPSSGGGSFAVANPGNYRTTPTVITSPTSVKINLGAGLDLTWSGSASAAWNINSANNWLNPSLAADVFYNLDKVTFPEGGLNSSVVLAGLLAPASLTVNASTTAYTLTSTSGNQLTGGAGITKTGTGTLTLAGPNLHSGTTSVGGGLVNFNDPASLGSGAIGNGIALSGGGILRYTGAVSGDLGVNRSIAVGTGGGSLSHNNATAATLTLSGNLSGNGSLNLNSQAAGGGTFALTGSNAGYTGAITVDSASTGISTLSILNQAAVPTASSITMNFAAAGAASSSPTLSLAGVTLPAATTLNLTSSTTATSLRTGVTTTGANVINGPINLAGGNIVQITPGTGSSVTLNGTIGEASPGSFVENGITPFSNVLFLRGTGTHIVNGQINLPSAGSTVAVTDGATVLLNSTGNDFKSASAAFGTIRLGANNAIPTTVRLVIGQAGDQAATLDLNGFNQTVTGLEWQAVTGNLLTKGISNTHATDTSTFTVNQATAPTVSAFNGTISGRTNLVKEGVATTTLAANASTFTGNVTVNAGTLAASSAAAAAGANGPLGASNVAGKTVTVNNAGSILRFTSNNVFGNGTANPDLPDVIINQGATLDSTRYNVIGDLALNGGTLSQTSSDAGGYQGFALRGDVVVGGSLASNISTTNGKGTHLGTNTTFTVANATGDAASDLNINTPLLNPSSDFGGIGGFTKAGAGTMTLSTGVTSAYTGPTVVSGGVLNVNGNIASSSSLSVGSGASVSGSGTLPASVTFGAGSVFAPGNSPGTITTSGSVTFSSTSVLNYEFTGNNTTVGGGVNDLLTGVTQLTLGGTLNVAEIGPGSFLLANFGDMWRIIDYSGTLTGSLALGTAPTLKPGLNFSVVTTTANQVNLVVVPETSAVSLLGLATLLTLRRRRIRNAA